ncbi:hypothetical protein F4777DRAFT_556048 [Nemania sp. FL0916]|nr:hypothetical protein F4777DRAFT_556048 [Nemania sp. FL0916]
MPSLDIEPANNDNAGSHGNTNENHASTGQAATISGPLEERAPIEPFPERSWHVWLNLGLRTMEYKTTHQKTPCIRSRRIYIPVRLGSGVSGSILTHGLEYKAKRIEYPFSKAYREMVQNMEKRSPMDRRKQADAESGQMGPPSESEIRAGENYDYQEHQEHERVVSYDFRIFRITLSSAITRDFKIPRKPTFIILGIFRRGRRDPDERVVFVSNPEDIFRKLRWASYRLRGIQGMLFSLTHVRGFRVYKCNPEKGTHERIELGNDQVADLQLLFHMFQKWHVSGPTARMWANWIHGFLNDQSIYVDKGAYSLELVLGWSIMRISVVVLLPVLLSLAIGIYINAKNWSDLATIQTAWGTASYVVTAGGLFAAFLALMTSVEYKQL